MDHGRRTLLITGAPGAGKSTVSRLVAERLERSALADGDFVHRLVVSGRVWALGEPADEAARQTRLCNENLCGLARSFMASRFTPVIDWIVPDGDQLDLYEERLGDALRLVVLAPGADTCRARNAARDPEHQFFFDGYDGLDARMREGFGDRGWWFDTADLTAEETAERVLAEAEDRARLSSQGDPRS